MRQLLGVVCLVPIVGFLGFITYIQPVAMLTSLFIVGTLTAGLFLLLGEG